MTLTNRTFINAILKQLPFVTRREAERISNALDKGLHIDSSTIRKGYITLNLDAEPLKEELKKVEKVALRRIRTAQKEDLRS